jgi:hypothetical protein
MALIEDMPNNINNNDNYKMNKYYDDKNNYPDEVRYVEDQYTLIIRRRPMGYNCGYIVLPDLHRYDGVDCDNIPVQVHGGLSYSAYENGQWVIGFDTAHLGDFMPLHNLYQEPNSYYWTHLDVLNELRSLIVQL